MTPITTTIAANASSETLEQVMDTKLEDIPFKPDQGSSIENQFAVLLSTLIAHSETQTKKVTDRLDALAHTVAAVEARVSRVEGKLGELKVEAIAAAATGGKAGSSLGDAELGLLNSLAKRLEGVAEATATGNSNNELAKTNTLEPLGGGVTTAIESLALRLEQLASSAQQQKAANTSALESLAGRLESASQSAAHAASLDKMQQLVDTMHARLERVETAATSHKVPAQVIDRLEQIMSRQTLLAQQLRDSVWTKQQESNQSSTPTSTTAADAELLEKLNQLDKKVEILPLIYMETFSTSLQRQTTALMGVMDEIIKEQTDTISQAAAAAAATAAAGRRTGGGEVVGKLGDVVDSVVHSMAVVPDMGIKKRFSQLTGYLRPGSGLGMGKKGASDAVEGVDVHEGGEEEDEKKEVDNDTEEEEEHKEDLC